MKSQREEQLSVGGSVTLSPATAPRRENITTYSENGVSRETREKIEMTTAVHARRSTHEEDVDECQRKYERWPRRKPKKRSHKKGRAKDQPRTPHYPRECVPTRVGKKIGDIRRQPAQDAADHDRRVLTSLEDRIQRQKSRRVARKAEDQAHRGSEVIPGRANESPSGGTPPLIRSWADQCDEKDDEVPPPLSENEEGHDDDDDEVDMDPPEPTAGAISTLSVHSRFRVVKFHTTSLRPISQGNHSLVYGFIVVDNRDCQDFVAVPERLLVFPTSPPAPPSPTVVAATMIQRAARRRSVIMLNRERRQHVAATTVQHVVKQAARRRRATKSKAATTIQSRVRGLLTRTLVCRDRSSWRTATLRIQRIFRGHRGRRIFKSMALKRAMAAIQVAEGVLARIEAVELETWGPHAVATVTDRVTWIAMALSIARLRAGNLRWVAATAIQRAARRGLANKAVTMIRRHKASVAIQRRTRGSRARAFVCRVRLTQRQLAAATIIQCAERRRLANKSAARLRRHQAAAAIQCANAAAAIIQGYARGLSARALTHGLRETRRTAAALRVQRFFRGYSGRRTVRSMKLARRRDMDLKLVKDYHRAVKYSKKSWARAPDDWEKVDHQDFPVLPRYEGGIDFTLIDMSHVELLTPNDWCLTHRFPVVWSAQWRARTSLMDKYFMRQLKADRILTLCDSEMRNMRNHTNSRLPGDRQIIGLSSKEKEIARGRGLQFIWGDIHDSSYDRRI